VRPENTVRTHSYFVISLCLWTSIRVLAMRKWPRGIGYKKHAIHKWIKEVGPCRDIVHCRLLEKGKAFPI
jgi:hypothetical protein